MTEIAAGIDIGATNTVIGFVDQGGHCYLRETLRTNDYGTASGFAEAISLSVRNGLESLAGGFRFRGIGIGAPNGNYHTGMIEFAVNLRWKEKIPLATMISSILPVPVILTNDANAAAMGEMVYGAARGMRDFIMITLGTGLGSGFVANGQLIYGFDGFAGELGHVIVEPGGRPCGCGRLGCLETHVSATGITRTVRELMKNTVMPSILRDLDPESLDSRKIYEAACAGDTLAHAAFDHTCRILGAALANVVAITSPEAIILFGGLAQAGKYLIEPVKKYMEEHLLEVFRNKVSILPSQLPENDAAILGAAALVWEH